MRKNRWYDCDPQLSTFIEGLKDLPRGKRDMLLSEMKNIILMYDEGLIDRHVADFPMDADRRRWYDMDPYSWLVINGLKHADEELSEAILIFAKNRMAAIAEPEMT